MQLFETVHFESLSTATMDTKSEAKSHLLNHPALATECFQQSGFGCLGFVPKPLLLGACRPVVGTTNMDGMLAALRLFNLLTELSLTGWRGVGHTCNLSLRHCSCNDVIYFIVADLC